MNEIVIIFPSSNWTLKIIELANKRFRYSLYWGRKAISIHDAETTIEELINFVEKTVNKIE